MPVVYKFHFNCCDQCKKHFSVHGNSFEIWCGTSVIFHIDIKVFYWYISRALFQFTSANLDIFRA